jgi:uncharacterized protein YndB with AHSA1/START domain
MRLMAIKDQFLVSAPIDLVFRSLADPRWQGSSLAPSGITLTLETGDPVRVGARFRMDRGVRGPWFWELTEYEPPTHLAADVWWSERGGTAQTTYDLDATPDGTVVRMRGSGFFGPVMWTFILLLPHARSAIKKGNRQLASAIERRLAPDLTEATTPEPG